MKIYKQFKRWWTNAYGGEYQHHCDFVMEKGETLSDMIPQVMDLETFARKVPEGKQWKVHLHFTYCEEDADG